MSEKRKRGRPRGITRKAAEDLGMNIRTVQRALARSRKREAGLPLETPEEKQVRSYITALRNFATFCRKNSPDDVRRLKVTDDQATKILEREAAVSDWLQRLYDQDQDQG